ncbi:MAG: exodeoxyribonuclease VII large subunit [Phycisphaerales bacterium]|nr:exodeoxyribonuclease VII large subunit [Phycisphaerales bacterium]
MAMDGAGSRQAQLKARIDDFRSKGLLDPDRKRPLPSCPRRIAVLTARTGAAIHDVQATARRRFPGCGLLLIDVPVQGEAAAPRIAEAITRTSASAAQLGIDAIILTRGGGSIEDLWAFNELAPAMAVLNSVVPVVAAIGHESDTTLVELVADHRASTPTQAAMVLLPDREEMLARVQHTGRLLHRTVARLCQDADAWLDGARRALDDGVHAMVRARRRRVQTCADALHAMRPEARLARRRGQAEAMARRLGSAVAAQVRGKRHRVDRAITEPMVRQMVVRGQGRVDTLDRTLDALDPRHVLERGYTLTLTTDGTLVRSPEQVAHGELLHTRTAKGDIAVRVEPQAVPSDHGSQAD